MPKSLKGVRVQSLTSIIAVIGFAALHLSACVPLHQDREVAVTAEAAVAPVKLSSELGYHLVRVNEAWHGLNERESIRLDYESVLPQTIGPLVSGLSLISTPKGTTGDIDAGVVPRSDQLSDLQVAYDRLTGVKQTSEIDLNLFDEEVRAWVFRGQGVHATGAVVPVEIVFSQRASRKDIITLVAVYPLSHVRELNNIRLIANAIIHPLQLRGDDGDLVVRPMALTTEDPNSAERIIHYYLPEHATLVARSHAVGNYQGCVATWVGPNTALTAAHCGGRNAITMEIYPDGDFDSKRRTTFTCNSMRATAFWASNSDLRVLECGQGTNPAPGDIYGWVDYSIIGYEQVGDTVYSVWTNRIDDVPGAGSSTKLYSEGVVVATNSGTWANPNCERPDHWLLENPSKGEPRYGHQTSVYAEKGASGSLQLSALTHTAVIAPSSTGNASRRFASSIGQILEVPGYIPPGEFYWLETNVDTAQRRPEANDRNEDTGCLLEENQHLLQNRVRSNASGTRALDVHEEIDNEITQRSIYNLDFNSEWRRLLWVGETAFGGFTRGLGYPAEKPWQTHAQLSTDLPGGAPGLSHSRLNLGLGGVFDVRIEYAWSDGAANLPDLEVSIEGCTSDRVSTTGIGPGAQNRGWHWVQMTLDTSECTGPGSIFLVNLASSGSIDLRRVVIVEEGATWDFETWDTREPWTEAGSAGRYENHALIYATSGNGSLFSSFMDPSQFRGHSFGLPSAPIRAGECYRMEFDARAVDGGAAGVTAIVAEGNGLGSIFEESVLLGSDWSHHAIFFETESGQADAVPRFEICSTCTGRIAVDNVRFVPQRDANLEVWVVGSDPEYVEIREGPDGVEAVSTVVEASAALPTCDDPDSNRLNLSTMEWLTDTSQPLYDLAGQPQFGRNATVPGSYLADGAGGFRSRKVIVTYAAEGQQATASVIVELHPCTGVNCHAGQTCFQGSCFVIEPITGTVMFVTGAPLAGVTIKVLSEAGEFLREAVTDSNGYYAVVASIGHILEVSAAGFETVRVPVTSTTMNIALH